MNGVRPKLPALREALEGRFDDVHALWIGAILAHIDFLDEQIDRLSDAIEEQIRPFAPAVELLRTIPGVQRRAAEVIISEIGTDMSVFPTAKHLASWAGQCPGNDQSAGKRRSGKTRKGSKWLEWTLEESAPAAATRRPSVLSSTRSCAPAGTCSQPASSTTTSAATTSANATPNAKPDASSSSSKRSDTPSRCTRRWQPERYFPVRPRRNGEFKIVLSEVRRIARHAACRGRNGLC